MHRQLCDDGCDDDPDGVLKKAPDVTAKGTILFHREPTPALQTRSLVAEQFRQGKMYRLLEWNALNDDQQQSLSSCQEEREIYGLFEPVMPSSGLKAKVAYRDVALLYLHLAIGDRIPHFLRISGSDTINNQLARLVLDQVIEVAWKNEFVSGPAALAAIIGESADPTNAIPGHVPALSLRAIDFGWMMDTTEPGALANCLYTFHTTPWSAEMKSKFRDPGKVLEYIFSTLRNAERQLLDRCWHVDHGAMKNGWRSWSRAVGAETALQQPVDIFKLYVSPVIEDIPDIFRHFIRAITTSDCFSFKIGGTVEDLLRPDKLVAYFLSREALMEAAALFREQLPVCTAQGVPFTVPLDEAGLLSWGVDSVGDDVPGLPAGGSWRKKMAHHIAGAIILAKKEGISREETTAFVRTTVLCSDIEDGGLLQQTRIF